MTLIRVPHLNGTGRLPDKFLPPRLSDEILDGRYIRGTARGASGGVASLGADGKVPGTQLPPSTSGTMSGVVSPEFYDPNAGTGGNDTAAIQACIDSGLSIWLTPGKVYQAAGLVPKSGMVMRGDQGIRFGSTTYAASLRAYGSGDLFVAPPEVPGVYGFRFENLVFDSTGASGTLFRGFWSQGSFSNVTWFQNNPNKSIFDVSGFLDIAFEGQCNMYHLTNSTVPAFRAVDASGNLAQVDFGKMRCQRTGVYFFHIEGTLGAVPIGFDFRNVNFEQCNGLVKMLSCRHFRFVNCGDWDHVAAQTLHPFYIGKSATANSLSPTGITFDNCIRDASIAPSPNVYDIYVEPGCGMAELNIDNCGHQRLEGYFVTCGGSTGRIRGSGPTAINALNMSTDVWQVISPTLGGSGTAVGNGSITGRMRRTGGTVEYRIKFTLGSTSTIGSQLLVNLPVPESGAGNGLVSVRGVAAKDSYYILTGGIWNASSVAVWYAPDGAVASVATTVPFTWEAGDVLEFSVIYESA